MFEGNVKPWEMGKFTIRELKQISDYINKQNAKLKEADRGGR